MTREPPYYNTEHYYDGRHFGKQDHERLRDCLKETRGMWLLSYNDCEAIRELYRDYQIEVVTTRYTLCGSADKIVGELLINNFNSDSKAVYAALERENSTGIGLFQRVFSGKSPIFVKWSSFKV